MDLFGRSKLTLLLIGGSTLIMLFLGWTFLFEGDKGLSEGFVPVNEQIQQILDGAAAATALPAGSTGTRTEALEPSATVTEASTEAPSEPKPAAQRDNESNKEAKAAGSDTGGKLNVNDATLEQLDALPGIGPSKAEAIIAYRKAKGSFRHIDELLEVKGIGPKILEKLKPHIYVAAP